MAKKFTDKSLIGSKSDEKIEYINECVREVCINGADLNNYEKMIGKLFPNEENFYMKVSAFITECGKLSSKSSISATFIANLKYLAREIYVTDDTVKEITRFTEQELQKRKKEAERKAEEERRRREAERKAEEERKRREAQHKAEEERKRKAEEERKRREAQRKAEEERKRKAEEERKRKEEEEKVETVRYYVNEYVRLACIEREFSNTLRDTIKWLIWPNEHDFFNKVDNFISKCHNLRNTFIMHSDVINLNNLARKIHVTDETVKEIVKFIEKEQEAERKRETERKAEEERKRKEAERKAEEERKRKEEEERKRKENGDPQKKSYKTLIISSVIGVGAIISFFALGTKTEVEPTIPELPSKVENIDVFKYNYWDDSVIERAYKYTGDVYYTITADSLPTFDYFYFSGDKVLENVCYQFFPHGRGFAEYSDIPNSQMRSYAGNFNYGMREGKNALIRYANGDKFEGEFRHDTIYSGKYTIADDGLYFLGLFRKNAPYNGTWYEANGQVYMSVEKGVQK